MLGAAPLINLPVTLVGPADDVWVGRNAEAIVATGTSLQAPLPVDGVTELLRRNGLALVTHSDRFESHLLALPQQVSTRCTPACRSSPPTSPSCGGRAQPRTSARPTAPATPAAWPRPSAGPWTATPGWSSRSPRRPRSCPGRPTPRRCAGCTTGSPTGAPAR